MIKKFSGIIPSKAVDEEAPASKLEDITPVKTEKTIQLNRMTLGIYCEPDTQHYVLVEINFNGPEKKAEVGNMLFRSGDRYEIIERFKIESINRGVFNE